MGCIIVMGIALGGITHNLLPNRIVLAKTVVLGGTGVVQLIKGHFQVHNDVATSRGVREGDVKGSGSDSLPRGEVESCPGEVLDCIYILVLREHCIVLLGDGVR